MGVKVPVGSTGLASEVSCVVELLAPNVKKFVGVHAPVGSAEAFANTQLPSVQVQLLDEPDIVHNPLSQVPSP